MKALKEYALLEYELCLLLKCIMQTEAQIASAIFYQISNTRARYAIIGSMLEIRHPDTFKKPWPRLEKWLSPCDTARNHIIHWGQDTRIMAYPVRDDANALRDGDYRYETVQDSVLTNNTRRWRASDAPQERYTEAKLEAWESKFRVVKHIVNRFNLRVHIPTSGHGLIYFSNH